jgi:hypothetical protein
MIEYPGVAAGDGNAKSIKRKIGEDEEEDLELVFIDALGCYYCPANQQYYEVDKLVEAAIEERPRMAGRTEQMGLGFVKREASGDAARDGNARLVGMTVPALPITADHRRAVRAAGRARPVSEKQK